MVDSSDKVSDHEVQENEEMSGQNQTPERVSPETNQKTCADCGTTKTPLWRGGPAGPKSLCNACGIRSRKKRRALLGLNKEGKKSKKSSNKSIDHHQHQNRSSSSSTSSSEESTTSNATLMKKSEKCIPFKKRLLHFGREVAMQRPRSNSTHRRKLGEEEQAAFLLMALSCGSVYA